jgi:hypothetical protein
VADAAGVIVAAGGSVGTTIEVLVARVIGNVGVLNGTDCVIWACTVRAAAVKTAFGCSVAGALDGKLHAESIKIITIRMEKLQATLRIGFSSLCKTILHPARFFRSLR